ncbi:hypothetical protein [Blastococcus sp. VKM Ac-2987]|uniref:hypothetical protein n=1 Tax=Blastococcus sp. VKM Ac-2987 TaxID=3004141 RepID=UPI0022ABB92B|nr:hypothetical protein [Blastococcus sp. VKM Ac-2987]MCZ2857807.1 hypothetical protein [Blastococcus sp. VKM Ac-2987]
MSVHVPHRPHVAPPPAAPQRPAAKEPPEKRGAEDRAWLLGLGIFAIVVLVFVLMAVLTALAGGDTYF